MPLARRGFLWHNRCVLKARLFIDGENFRHKVEEVLRLEGLSPGKFDFARIDLNKLISSALGNVKASQKLFYGSKIHYHEETKTRSGELIATQRYLKGNLEKQGFEYIIAGHVRGQTVFAGKDKKLIFKEKGVDVKIAVDMISGACDKVADMMVLCSSDSDLQPAVKEVRRRGIKIIYLGFATNPNKGLSQTTNQTILFRNSEVLDACVKRKVKNKWLVLIYELNYI